MRSHSHGVRSDVYRIPMLIGESESLYNCKMHDLSSFSQRSHFLNRLLDGPRAGYDAMLIIYDTPALHAGVYRNIGFRKTATGYKWIFEQEIHPGPRTFKQLGNTDHQWHTAHEWIVITYDTVGMLGAAPGKLDVHYDGFDSRIADRKDLTLDEARPILAEWSQRP